MTAAAQAAPARPLVRAGFLLGFAFGGFFDGILLHQILQWHHLLSAVEGAAFRDLRVQVLADGLFHALHYVLALAGLWLLWRGRREAAEVDRSLLAWFLVGFGAWHILDAVLSHWLLGIHRIRMASENPLAWDLVFFALGLLACAAGWALSRDRRPPSTAGGPTGAARVRVLLAAAVLIAGAVSLRPEGGTAVPVLFPPGTEPATVFAAMAALDARAVAADPSGTLWVLDLPAGADRSRLYREGALLVGGSLFPVACIPGA